MHKDIKRVFFSEDEIKQRTIELGEELTKEYEGKNPLVLCVLKGASLFMTDLIRHIQTDLEIDFMAVSSYGSGTVSSGEVRILKDLDASIENRHVLIVEDIVDSGLTLSYLLRTFEERNPASTKICALLLKEKTDPDSQLFVNVDYVGFTVPDEFVVGYGLDFNEKYRNLPYIGVLKEEVYQ